MPMKVVLDQTCPQQFRKVERGIDLRRRGVEERRPSEGKINI